MASDAAMLQIFTSTLSPDKATREQAEAALTHFSSNPQFVTQLITFACQQLQTDSSATVRHVLHAASIRVRNIISRGSWNRQSYFTEEVKCEIRQLILPAQCAPHVPELIRRQLLDATREIIRYDYPTRWPTLMPQLHAILDACMVHLRVGDHPTSQREASVLQLKGALNILRVCCKHYESPVDVDADAMDAFIDTLCPSLMSLVEFLVCVWIHELTEQQRQQQESVNYVSYNQNQHPFDISPWFTEVSHCLRIAFKCFLSLASVRWPRFLCDVGAMEQFCQRCIERLLEVMRTTFLPLCHQSIPFHDGNGSDFFSLFNQSAVWRLLKVVENVCLKMLQELMFPKSCEHRAREAAKYFCERHLLPFVRQALNLVRWHALSGSLTSKAYIIALEILSIAVGTRTAYREVIEPHAEEIITRFLFPRLAFVAADMDLWVTNPAEYVRRQTDPAGDLYNARVVSASLMLSLAEPTRPFHNTRLMGDIVRYVLGQLEAHAAEASRGSIEAARAVDAALFTIHQFSRVLHVVGFEKENIEWFLTRHVVPAAKYPVGFLRARSVLLLSSLAPKIQWSSAETFQRVLADILPLLQDAELPVRIQACACISPLICHPHARGIATHIGDIIQNYFDVMRLMDCDEVVRTLRKTIRHYRHDISQWALQLTTMLVQYLEQVLQRAIMGEQEDADVEFSSLNDRHSTRKEMEMEEGGFADSIMTADEVLDTLITVVRALPQHHAISSATPMEGNIVLQIQQCITPVLLIVLSNGKASCFGFMESALLLLTTVLSKSPAVEASMWQLLLCLHQLILEGAVDYFGQMLPPLDNYVSVAPALFLFSPMCELCDLQGVAADVAARTPSQVVCAMCDVVLNSSYRLQPRELSAVPMMCDAMLQNLWLLKQNSCNRVPAVDSLVEYVVRSASRMLAEPVNQRKQRRTLALLFVNSIFSALLADTALTVVTLTSAGTFSLLFAHYVTLVQEKAVQAMMRSYDRRLFVMAIASLMRLFPVLGMSQDKREIAASIDEVLCGVLQCQVFARYSELERVEVAAELQRRAAQKARKEENHHQNGNWEDDEEEWSNSEESVLDNSDDDDDGEEEDEAEMSEDGSDEEALLPSGDAQLRAMIAAARTQAGEDDLDDDNSEDVEDNLLDDVGFVSPIDGCNAWAILLESVHFAAMAVKERNDALLPFVELLRENAVQQQLQSVQHVSRMMEELIEAREKKKKNEKDGEERKRESLPC